MSKPYVSEVYVPRPLPGQEYVPPLPSPGTDADSSASADAAAVDPKAEAAPRQEPLIHDPELLKVPPARFLTLQTMDFLGRYQLTTVDVTTVERSSRLGLSSFCDVATGKDFYLDEPVWREDGLPVFALLRARVLQLQDELVTETKLHKKKEDEEYL